MTTTHHDTEKARLRQRWLEVGKSVTDERSQAMRRAIGRRNSLVTKLRCRYMFQAIIGITAPVWIFILNAIMPVSWALISCYSGFCILFAVLNFFVWCKLGGVSEYMGLPLVVAQRNIIWLNLLRRNIKVAGWILGIPLVIFFFYEVSLYNDPEALTGGVIGGIVGGIIGLIIEIKNRRQMKALIRFFSSLDEDCD